MEQLSWMFSFLFLVPDIVWHITVAAGIVGLLISIFIRFIPFLGLYKFPIQIISMLALLAGTYMEGGMDCRNAGKEQDEKFRAAENKAKEANDKLQAAMQSRSDQIATQTDQQVKYIDRVKTVVQTVPGEKILETVVKDMSPEERAKYEAKSKEEKEEFERQLKLLQNNLKNCPVPVIILEEMNKAAKGDAK
jgi:hypothetical protein